MWGNIHDLLNLLDTLAETENRETTVELDMLDYDEDGYLMFGDDYVCTDKGGWLRVVVDPDTNLPEVICELDPALPEDIEI